MERSTIEERPGTDQSTTTAVQEHPATVEEHPTPTSALIEGDVRRTASVLIPRSRGAVSGVLLAVLGLWGGFAPFAGPYFGYEFGSDQTWVISWDRAWLVILPAAAVLLGGLVLLAGRTRVGAALGAALALTGGIWFVVGPTASMLWDSALSPSTAIGQPLGSTGLGVIELLGSFYVLGSVGIGISAFALGRLSLVSARDIDRVRRHGGIPPRRRLARRRARAPWAARTPTF